MDSLAQLLLEFYLSQVNANRLRINAFSLVGDAKKYISKGHGNIANEGLTDGYVPDSISSDAFVKKNLSGHIHDTSIQGDTTAPLVSSKNKKYLLAGGAVLGVAILAVFYPSHKNRNMLHTLVGLKECITHTREREKSRLENDARLEFMSTTEKSLLTHFIDLNDLENTLSRFNAEDLIVAPVLNQLVTYTVSDTDILYSGTLLGALFFKALVSFNQAALELFLKYDIHNKIKITLHKNDQGQQYPALSLYMGNGSIEAFKMSNGSCKDFESKYNFCVDLMAQNNILQDEGEKELCRSCLRMVTREIIKRLSHVKYRSKHRRMKCEDFDGDCVCYGDYNNLESLEYLLLRSSDQDSILTDALKQQEKSCFNDHFYEHKLRYEGSLLEMLFFKAAVKSDEAALMLFFKHNIHKTIETFIGDHEKNTRESSLLSSCTNIIPVFRFFYSKTPCLDLVLQNVALQNDTEINEIQKKQFTEYITCALKASIQTSMRWEKDDSIIIEGRDIDLKALKQVLLLFAENNPAITAILNQDNTLMLNHYEKHEDRDYILYQGTVLKTLFFQSALTLNEEALQLFFKYGIHEKIEMKLFKNKEGDRYLSLPTYILSTKMRARATKSNPYYGELIAPSKKLSCIELMVQNGMVQKHDQIEEFITYLIESKNFTPSLFHKVLRYAPDLKNLNPYYQGTNVVSFINSKSMHEGLLTKLIKCIFLDTPSCKNDYVQFRKCTSHILSTLYRHTVNQTFSEDTLEKSVMNCMHLLLSYGVNIEQEDMVNLHSIIEDPEIPYFHSELEENNVSNIHSISEKIEPIEKILKEEIDLREKFLQFDEQENRSELFNTILRRSAEPMRWMERVIQLKSYKISIPIELSLPIQYRKNNPDRQIIPIYTLVTYCIKHFHELLSPNSPRKNHIHYLESWTSFIKLFFEKGNCLEPIMLPSEKRALRNDNKKLLDACIVKIIEYNYFNERSDEEIALKPFLLYCFGQDNPKIPFPDLCEQGKLGNIFHLGARSGMYNQTIADIMETAKNKGGELAVLRALKQVFKQDNFNDGYTPLSLAKEVIDRNSKEGLDSSDHEETLAIMNNFVDTYKKLSD